MEPGSSRFTREGATRSAGRLLTVAGVLLAVPAGSRAAAEGQVRSPQLNAAKPTLVAHPAARAQVGSSVKASTTGVAGSYRICWTYYTFPLKSAQCSGSLSGDATWEFTLGWEARPLTLVVVANQSGITPAREPAVLARIEPYQVFDDAKAAKMFTWYIAPVLLSPRCRNCHVAGEGPRQGDDSHPHAPPVTRTSDCSQCHKQANQETPPFTPGAAGWHMPSAKRPLIFAGRTPSQLCEQLKEPAQNGGLGERELREHARTDSKLLWGFKPGGQRTVPPVTWETLVTGVDLWIQMGSACP